MMTKDEYIKKYISLRSKVCVKPEDYTKSKIKTHNKAVLELISLVNEIRKNNDLSEEVFSVLLDNEDIYIQQSAATDCLNLNLHVIKAIEILERVKKKGDRMAAMGAERTLKVWRGEIKSDKPF